MCSAITKAGESLELPVSLAIPGRDLATDELTGFLTRPSLIKLMKSPEFRAVHPALALVKVELSRFELMGIGQGPDRADLVLARTGQRLVRLFRQGLAFARMGEARFAMLLSPTPDMADHLARLLDVLQRPMAIEGEILVVRPQIGVATLADADHSETRLIQAAGAALHQAATHNQGIMFFQPEMLAQARDSQALENDLRLALALKSTDLTDTVNNAEFSIMYQPIINNLSGSVHGFEALIRWNHPRFGPISPSILIPMAEQTGVMPLLGSWIIRKAMLDAASWPANRDGNLPRVNINLSARQFDQPEQLLAIIASAISHAGIVPGRICLEMTESNYLSPSVKPHLDALRALGCSLAMDDFGTGYSALASLVDLPLDYLKIDRSLVVDLDSPDQRISSRARRLMSSVIGLADGLGLRPVVEGVETGPQLLTVSALGAELIQGHVHHAAMPADQIADFMRTASSSGHCGE